MSYYIPGQREKFRKDFHYEIEKKKANELTIIYLQNEIFNYKIENGKILVALPQIEKRISELRKKKLAQKTPKQNLLVLK
jgi:hypothetical protein